jgi:hypothetical protein
MSSTKKSESAGQIKEYAGRALPGPNYRLTGPLAKAREQDHERIAALKRSDREDRSSPSASS